MRTWPRIGRKHLTSRAALSLAAALAVLGPAVYAQVATTAAKRPGHRSFAIKGNLRGPLWPGSSQPVDLALRSGRRSTLWVTRLTVRVSVDRAHSAAGCSAGRDFLVRQLPAAAYPIRLPRKRTRRRRWRPLSALGVRALPSVWMPDLLRNQDACKGASLRLRYTGRARERRRGVRRLRAAGVLSP